MDLFQFMIGNRDYSNLQAPDKKDCCHNIKLMSHREQPAKPYIPIPFDFDNSGLVNARYAVPPGNVPISAVRQRNYRGLCEGNDHLKEAITVYQAAKPDMMDLISQDQYLDSKTRKRAMKYLTGFFDIIDTPKRLNRAVISACR